MKYKLDSKGIAETVEQLKQTIIAIAEKIKRYANQVIQFQQNLHSRANQHQFYKTLENMEGLVTNNVKPGKEGL